MLWCPGRPGVVMVDCGTAAVLNSEHSTAGTQHLWSHSQVTNGQFSVCQAGLGQTRHQGEHTTASQWKLKHSGVFIGREALSDCLHSYNNITSVWWSHHHHQHLVRPFQCSGVECVVYCFHHHQISSYFIKLQCQVQPRYKGLLQHTNDKIIWPSLVF